MNIYSTFTAKVFYNLLDDGVANFLGLETLRHGTNPISNLLIRFTGGNPNLGDAEFGSGGSHFSCDRRFYVFKDHEYLFEESEYALEESKKRNRNNPLIRILGMVMEQKGLGNRIAPRIHAAISGFNCTTAPQKKISELSCFKVSLGFVSGAFSVLFSPTLRFRFSKMEENFSGKEGRFQNDEAYNGLAYHTQQVVEPWRIGLIGSLITGVNTDWYSRVKANPLKILTGIVQLTCAIAMAILYVHIVIANPICSTVGMLLA